MTKEEFYKMFSNVIDHNPGMSVHHFLEYKFNIDATVDKVWSWIEKYGDEREQEGYNKRVVDEQKLRDNSPKEHKMKYRVCGLRGGMKVFED